MKVSSTVRSTARRHASLVSLHDFIGLSELRFDEEIAYGAGDVRLGFIERVSLKDGGGEPLELGVIDVCCRGLSLSFIPLLHWEDSQFVAEVAVI